MENDEAPQPYLRVHRDEEQVRTFWQFAHRHAEGLALFILLALALVYETIALFA